MFLGEWFQKITLLSILLQKIILFVRIYTDINASQNHHIIDIKIAYRYKDTTIIVRSFKFFKSIIDINTHDVSGYTIAAQYLRNLQISEAEMTQYLCNIKMATANALTKKYNVPFFSYVLQDKTVNKYLNRAARFKSLTLTQYIR